MNNMKPLTLALLLALLPGCSSLSPLQLQPDDQPRAPNQWRHASASSSPAYVELNTDATHNSQASGSESSVQHAEWWRSFGSAELDGLIATADSASYSIAAAAARVRQAQAQAVVAGAPLLPEVNGSASLGRQRPLAGLGNTAPLSQYGAGIAASYEIDFWGKNRAGYQAALANLQASQHDRDTIILTLRASIANSWLQTMGLRERVQIASRNLDNAQRVLQLVESRFAAGAATAIELSQQRGLVAAQQRNRALLQQQAGAAEATLATLLSRPVTDLNLQGSSQASTLVALSIPQAQVDLPSSLLTRRPDIARAEASLLAAEANIRVARAAMLPSISLTAGVSTQSEHLRSMWSSPLTSLAAGLTAPIFNAGRLAAQRDTALARREELLADYRQVIINAFSDVEIALNLMAGLEQQAEAQAVELANAERAFALAESRYRAGAETLLTMLDTQRTLFVAQDLNLQLRQLRLQSSVDLYRALGGGWLVRAS